MTCVNAFFIRHLMALMKMVYTQSIAIQTITVNTACIFAFNRICLYVRHVSTCLLSAGDVINWLFRYIRRVVSTLSFSISQSCLLQLLYLSHLYVSVESYRLLYIILHILRTIRLKRNATYAEP